MKLLTTALGLVLLAAVPLESQETDSIGGITVQTVGLAEDVSPVLSGRVIEARTGKPLPGVQFWLDGTDVGYLTDESGFIHLSDAEAGSWTLRIKLLGYRQDSVALRLHRSTAVHVLAAMRANPRECLDCGWGVTVDTSRHR